MGKPKIIVSESCDGFYITLHNSGIELDAWRFDQEDTKEKLVEVFHTLGFEAEYEEVC